jgi:hypothetical protein
MKTPSLLKFAMTIQMLARKALVLIIAASLVSNSLSIEPAQARFLQEDSVWFDAGDLNVYRYTGNNPVNATDPSGMTAARERQAIDGIGLALIRGGAIATRFMLSSGARTAQFMARQDKVALSAIAGSIACSLFILADAVAQAGPNTRIVGVNSATCGVAAISVPILTPKDRSVPMPPLPKKGCTCTARADANTNIPSATPAFAFGTATANSCPEAARKAEAIATHKLGQQPKHVKKRCNGR